MTRSSTTFCAALLLHVSPVGAECSVSKFAELPVTMDGLRPIVSAMINGHEVNFVADSGAFVSLISPSVAAELKLALAPTPFNFQLRGIGGVASSSLTQVKSFAIAGVSIPDVTFLVGGSDSGRAGLLGQNVLGRGDTEYDLAGGVIRLFRTKGCSDLSMAYWAGSKPIVDVALEPSEARNPHIVAFVWVNGMRMRATFDTGAPRSMLTLKAAERAGVKSTDPTTKPAGFSGGLGPKATQSWTAPFKSFAIGSEQIQNAQLRFANVPEAPFDMLLGADFFLSHRIFVSNAQRRMFLTYNGGPVFDLRASRPLADAAPPDAIETPPTPAAQPNDANGFMRRGAAFAARGDFTHALADLSRAIALAPGDPRYLVARADAYMANRQPLLAKSDLDGAIRIRPDHVDALMARAALYLATDHPADGLADLHAATQAAPREANLHLRLGDLFQRAGAFDRAIHEYDLWTAIRSRDDSHMPQALNGRCWSRAMLGQELEKALEDCNAAVRLAPRSAAYLDSRGLVRLRLGDLDRAIADYDAALAIRPYMAWSLYGRGLAKLRKGLTSQADADIAAATATDPHIAEHARLQGVNK